jgi:glutaredoxin
MAKQFLNQNQVPFAEKNVATDLEARKEMVEKSGQLGVPVIDVAGEIMVGFDEQHLAHLVGLGK